LFGLDGGPGAPTFALLVPLAPLLAVRVDVLLRRTFVVVTFEVGLDARVAAAVDHVVVVVVVVVVVKRGFHLAHEAVVLAVEEAVPYPDPLAALHYPLADGADDARGMVEEAVGQLCTEVVWLEGHPTAGTGGSEPPVVVPPAVESRVLVGVARGLEVVPAVDAL
jgi:hypothetical protein